MKNHISRMNGGEFPTRRIRSVVRTVLPEGTHFRMRVIDSKIGGMKIVRVITPAWKKLSHYDRILRILRVANTKLSNADRKSILRFSVLTPEESKLLTHSH